MDCKTAFKIDIMRINDNNMYEIIDLIGIEPGITDSYLYYGMLKRDTTEDNYTLFEQLNDTLSIIYDKKEILKSLTNQFNIFYEVDVKFSYTEDEEEQNVSLTIAEESIKFIKDIDASYYINNQLIEL